MAGCARAKSGRATARPPGMRVKGILVGRVEERLTARFKAGSQSSLEGGLESIMYAKRNDRALRASIITIVLMAPPIQTRALSGKVQRDFHSVARWACPRADTKRGQRYANLDLAYLTTLPPSW